MELLARGAAGAGFQRVLRLLLSPGVVGVLGARPAVIFADVALLALAAVAARGVDADVRAERLIAAGALIDIQAVGLLPPTVSLPVVSVTRVTGTQHSAEVIRALLLAGSFGTNVVIFRDTLSKNKFVPFTALFPETRGELARRLQTRVLGRGDLVLRADFPVAVSGLLPVGPRVS